jgi:hypothetical protein
MSDDSETSERAKIDGKDSLAYWLGVEDDLRTLVPPLIEEVGSHGPEARHSAAFGV